MSASNKKKLRKQEAQAQMTNRQQAASKEAKKQKAMSLTFIIAMALVVCITIGALLSNPVMNVVYRNTKAVQVGDYTINAVELNYFYKDAVSQFYSNYKSYISYLLSTTAPLNEQIYDKTSGKTWADYFVDQAHNNIKATYAVYDLAVAEGFTLSDDYKASLDNTMMYLSLYASFGGFSNVDAYLVSMYGNGATEESYRAYYEKCLIAEAYYTKYSEDLEYTPDQLSAYNTEHPGEFLSYSFSYYYLAANKFYPEGAGTKGEDGKTTYTDEEMKAAVEAAKAAADSLAAGEYADVDAFNAAINALDIYKNEQNNSSSSSSTTKTTTNTEESEDNEETEGEEEEKEEKPEYKYTATVETDVLYSKVRELFRDWVIGKVTTEGEEEDEDKDPVFETRVQGDMTVIAYTTTSGTGENAKETTNGYYVLRYESCNDNTFLLRNVRHILVKFEKSSSSSGSSSSTEYTKEEKLKAKTTAEELLKQWKDGEATEDSFAALAKEKTGDAGSKENGGLYENVFPGQMVENFENWVFDENRQVGDVEIIETTYGYHIMYYVGEGDISFIDYMLTETLRSEDTAAWYEALVEKMNLVAITDKFVDKRGKIA